MKYAKISIIINEKPPFFIGSQIRGAFGYALKKVTCINPAFKCEGCFAKESCLYYDFFERRNVFHKYRLDFELGKRFYEFSLYLFEDAIKQVPYVISALHMMLTKNGLGYERKTMQEFELYLNDENIIKNGTISLPKEYARQIEIKKIFSDVTLTFVTPMRMKKNNRLIHSENIELKDIVNSIYQRQMQLLGREYRRFPYEIQGEIVKKDLHFKELTRRSNRQKTTMQLGGIVGNMQLKGINKEVSDILQVGEIIGVGKSCVFGLGKIEVGEV